MDYRPKNILELKTGENWNDLQYYDQFLDTTLKVQYMKENFEKLDFIPNLLCEKNI